MALEQEHYFKVQGGDDYFDRNHPSGSNILPTSQHPLVELVVRAGDLKHSGAALVVGGGVGREAAEFHQLFPNWRVTNLDVSRKAIAAGRLAFPNLKHVDISVTASDFVEVVGAGFDVVLVTATLCWIDRSVLTMAIANIDASLVDEGLLGIADFYPPRNIRREMKHASGIYTYKQDYASIFTSLGTYQNLARRFDASSPTEEWSTDDLLSSSTLLRKNLQFGYLV